MDSEIVKFVFVGDTHGFIDDFSKQKEIIERINPRIILSESMQDISLVTNEDYIKIFQRKKISEMISFEEMEPLMKLCHKKKIKLIGMDFHNFGFNEKLQKIVKGEIKPLKKDINEIKRITKSRQTRHLEMLKKFENKSKNSILVLIGAWHLSEDSLIMKSLKNYKIIFPCDKHGKILTKPSKAGDIHYCVRVKNE